MSEKIKLLSPKKPQAAEKLIYCGPNISGLASTGSVFTTLPVKLEEYFTDCPELKAFFVPLEKFLLVRSAITKKGSLEHSKYQKALQYLNMDRR